MFFSAHSISAMPLKDYHKRIQQALGALATLTEVDEGEGQADRRVRTAETLRAIRTILPETANIEWNGASLKVDNSWLQKELESYEKVPETDRESLLAKVMERLQALEERLAEIDNEGQATTPSKAESSRRLAEILGRPEYARKVNEDSAFARLWKQFLKWIEGLIPKQRSLAPGRAAQVSNIAQVLVILLALAVLAYVIKIFAPRLFQKRGSKQKGKQRPRIVLGEKLEADESAGDLLAEAEALARKGELRAAIRKAYIALLVELGERKVISLAQHKTNRDYLRAVREVEPLYGDVKRLTESFEWHWYGFGNATEDDWLTFRTTYKQALSQ